MQPQYLPALPKAMTPDNRTLVIKLDRRASGPTRVLACEIQGSNYTNRTVFHGSCSLAEVFVASLAEAVERMLTALEPVHHVRSMPDFVFELPGLTLAVARLIVSEVQEGGQRIMIRFRTFLGSLNKALIPTVGFGSSRVSSREKVAMDVLADIAMPLLNLCRAAELDASLAKQGSFSGARHLVAQAHEIAFRVELLKRFVSTSELAAQAPTPLVARQDDDGT